MQETGNSRVAHIAEMRTLPVQHFSIDCTVFIHWIFDIVAKDGSVRRLAMEHWCGGRIFRERFYYDPPFHYLARALTAI